MPMKLVDGELVELTPSEEQEYNDRLNNPPPPLPKRFTPLQIVDGFYAMIGQATTLQLKSTLEAADPAAFERWRAATLVDEDDPMLLAQLSAAGKTIEDLKAAIEGLE